LFLLFSKRQWVADLKGTYRFFVQVELLFDDFSWCNPSKGAAERINLHILVGLQSISGIVSRLQNMRKPILALFNSFKEDVLMFSE